MFNRNSFKLSRRRFTGTAALAGIGVGLGLHSGRDVRAMGAATEAGDPERSLATFARIRGTGAQGRANLGWFDGTVVLVLRGRAQLLCRYAGVARTSAVAHCNGAWRIEQQEIGVHYDRNIEGSAPVVVDPFSTRRMAVLPQLIEPWSAVFEPAAAEQLRWSATADHLTVDEGFGTSSLYATNGLGTSRPMLFLASASHVVAIRAVSRRGAGPIPSTGMWTRIAPLPDWLDTTVAEGHCVYQCRYQAGLTDASALPAELVRALRGRVSEAFLL